MSSTPPVRHFGPFTLDLQQGTVTHGAVELSLTPKAIEILAILVGDAGRTVAKDELLRRAWPDAIVDENNLAQNISALRRELAAFDDAEYIRTIPRRGYRFVGALREAFSPEPEEAARRERPHIHYAQSGDVRIAYQVVGTGPIDVVFVMGWVSHLEMYWEEPSFARFLDSISSFSRLILFDKRGTGLSDRVPLESLPTLEDRMDDVRAVMDAVGSSNAVLVGVSEGAPMSCLFAATYPRKTAGIVLIGGYSRRVRSHDYPWGSTEAAREAWIERMESEWGGPVGIEERAPSRASDPAFREWWARYLRMGASPGAVSALTRMNARVDVRHVLPTIHVPALVIHRTGDLCLDVEEGRYMADRIPGARFLELPGNDHLPFVGDQDSIVDAIRRFCREVGDSSPRTLVLATVLTIRPVDGMAISPALRREIEAELAWQRGDRAGEWNEVLTAIFDGPARAIRSAVAILESGRRAGITFSAGLHTGECDLIRGRIAGVALGISDHVSRVAGPGEIVASQTVRDLVAGSGIEFDEPVTADFDEFGCWDVARIRP